MRGIRHNFQLTPPASAAGTQDFDNLDTIDKAREESLSLYQDCGKFCLQSPREDIFLAIKRFKGAKERSTCGRADYHCVPWRRPCQQVLLENSEEE